MDIHQRNFPCSSLIRNGNGQSKAIIPFKNIFKMYFKKLKPKQEDWILSLRFKKEKRKKENRAKTKMKHNENRNTNQS